MRIGHAVGADQTVVAEVLVGSVIVVEVAAIGIDGHAVFAGPADRLVNEIPDVASLIFRILADEVPVFLESALRVTHGVGIFALDQRLGVFGVLGIFLAVLVGVVHRAEYVGLAVDVGLFVLNRARGVLGLYPVVGGLEVGSVAGLVAERPYDDARMVVEVLHVALVAFHVCFCVCRVLGECLVAVAHTVRFDVGFCGHVDTVFVAQVIPHFIVGIVACAHCVDVELLHHLDVLKHAVARHYVSAVGVKFVAVGTLDEHRLAVDKKLCVLDFDAAETYLDGNHFGVLAVFRESGLKFIEVGCLGSPLFRICHFHYGADMALGVLFVERSHFLALCVEKRQFEVARTLDVDVHAQSAVFIVVGEVGVDADVLDTVLGAGIQIAVAGQTGVAEEVLVLEIRAVAPAEHLHDYCVLLAGNHVFGDIEFVGKF